MRRRITFSSSLLLWTALSLASAAVALADGGGAPYPR